MAERIRIRAGIWVVAVVLSGCAINTGGDRAPSQGSASVRVPAAPVPEGARYFPYQPGNRWEYVDEEGRPVLTITVKDTQVREEKVHFSVREENNDGTYADRNYRLEEQALFTTRITGSEGLRDYTDNPQPMLIFPVKDGQVWNWSSHSPGRRTYDYSGRIVGTDQTRVPAGIFSATKIEITASDLNQKEYTTLLEQWVVPEIGTVRMEYSFRASPSHRVLNRRILQLQRFTSTGAQGGKDGSKP